MTSLSRGVNSPLPVCGRCVKERCGFGNSARTVYLDRARHDWKPASPRTLRDPEREIDRNVAWRRTALRTTARQDFSRARVVCKNSKTGSKRGGRNGSAVTELLTKKRQTGRQNVIFCRNRSTLKKSNIKKFSPEFYIKVSEVNFDLARLN
jgi:hypothetical protein